MIDAVAELRGPQRLAVQWDTPGPYVLDRSLEIGFTVLNPGAEDYTYPSLAVQVEGPSKAKVTVSLFQDRMVVPAGGKAANKLILEPNEPWTLADEATVFIKGERAA